MISFDNGENVIEINRKSLSVYAQDSLICLSFLFYYPLLEHLCKKWIICGLCLEKRRAITYKK